VIALKGNQGTLHNDVRLFLEDPDRLGEVTHTTVDADHGRIETRTGTVCSDIGWAQDLHAWPGLAAIGKMVRRRETQGKTTTETAYYLLSTPLSAARFTEVARAQWGIENRLHWVLDVTMNEDRKRNWKDHGPENIGMLRRLALNLAKLEGSKGSIKGKLKRAGWNDEFLSRLLAQFAKSHMR
jgi:predicted transposase YbfD/YdcC